MNNLRLRFLWPLWLFGFLSAIGAATLMGQPLAWFFGSHGVLLGGGVFLLAFLIAGWLLTPTEAVMSATSRLLKGLPPEHETAGWLPEEFWKVRTDINLNFSKQRQALKAAEDHACQASQRLQHAERLVREAFGAMQGLFAASDEGVAVMDAQGTIIASNEKLDQFLGAPLEQLAGRDGTKLVTAFLDRLESNEDIAQWMANVADDEELDARLTCSIKNNPQLATELHSLPMKADGGTIIGRIWVLRDRSKVKGLEKQLRESQKLGNLGLIAGGIAHDFNNLLTAISGNLALAEMTPPERTSDVRTCLDGANQAAGRAAQLVKQLLGYSRRGPSQRATTSAKRVAADVEALLKHSVDPLITVVSESTMDDSFIDADPVQIEQVLLNLGINARDAMPKSGGTIEIAVSNASGSVSPHPQSSPTSDHVVFRIRDNGHGISEEDRHRVFEAFFTTKSEGKGTGLGLSTAQDIVRDHGGWIEFDSEIDKGSEFRVYLPRVETPVEDTEALSAPSLEEAAPPASEALIQSGQRRTVLVVDDEAPVRAIAANMLGFLGYEVIEASNGRQALDIVAAADRPIDAILLDIYMPKLSGRDTFQQLRASGNEIPVVVCSGFVIDPDEFVVLSQGGTPPSDIMVKPYTLDGLRKTMSRALIKANEPASKNAPAMAS